jgi:2-amino-4-hydroxy-6-hydroxymethyldihydropteridine diphosphokinase
LDKFVYIGLGSNIGDRFTYIKMAISDIRQKLKGEILAISSVYETSPVGVDNQPYFLNCVCLVKTKLDLNQVLKKLLVIEKKHGRNRKGVMDARTLDLDILLCDEFTLNNPDLVVPHPRIAERAFVLTPLVEINPTLKHPSWKMNVTEMLECLSTSDTVEKVGVLTLAKLN